MIQLEIYEIYVDEEDNERIDQYLAKELDNQSRSYIQKLIKEKLIKVNNKDVKASYIVNEGDHIVVNLPEAKELEILAEDLPINIVYEDDDLVVLNKEPSMVVHPAPGNYRGTLVNALLFHIKKLSSINGVIRPGIVHRLDKDTSGLIIVAKNDKSHRFLSEEIKNRKIERYYMALVHGNIKEDKATINAPIGRNKKDRKKMAVTQTNSKEAISHYVVKERFGKYTLVEVKLETGRTHQIRVHMASITHPVLGDPLYSSGKNEFGLERQMLHAYKLSFNHPTSGKLITLEAELPKDFEEVLLKLENKKI